MRNSKLNRPNRRSTKKKGRRKRVVTGGMRSRFSRSRFSRSPRLFTYYHSDRHGNLVIKLNQAAETYMRGLVSRETIEALKERDSHEGFGYGILERYIDNQAKIDGLIEYILILSETFRQVERGENIVTVQTMKDAIATEEELRILFSDEPPTEEFHSLLPSTVEKSHLMPATAA